MGKRFLVFFLTLIILVGASGIYVVGGLQAYFRYQQSSLANQEHCGGQPPVHVCVRAPLTVFSAFYPSYVTNQVDLFTIEYSSSYPVTLIVSGSISGFSQQYSQTVNATSTIQSIRFTPPLINQVLRKFTTSENTALHVMVTDTKRRLYYLGDSPLLLHPRLLMQWETTNLMNLAAWITPNDPAIATLIAKATTHLPSTMNSMVGYNKATPQMVKDQVNAIYDTLLYDYHIHYVSEGIPYGSPGDSSRDLENIKLPADVLQQRSGMCVELTTLLASAVESIGMNAEVVIIPGHAFLGVALAPDNRQFEYWDPVEVSQGVAGDSANLFTDNNIYLKNLRQHTILSTILISDARKQGIDPMV